jgi:hypothetical protein
MTLDLRIYCLSQEEADLITDFWFVDATKSLTIQERRLWLLEVLRLRFLQLKTIKSMDQIETIESILDRMP